MITSIAIENFKGIRERVELDLASLTFLFGANNAGKSTVTDAMEFLDAVLETRSAMPELSSSTWKQRFVSIVHGHDTSLSLSVGLTCELSNDDDSYFVVHGHEASEGPRNWSTPIVFGSLFDGSISSISIEMSISSRLGLFYDTMLNGAFIERIRFSACGDDIVSIRSVQSTNKWAKQRRLEEFEWKVNLRHELLCSHKEDDDPQELIFRGFSRHIMPREGEPPLLQGFYEALEKNGPIPNDTVANILNALLSGAIPLICARLKQFRKIGALRSIPERNTIRFPNMRTTDWHNGLAAWDDLAFCGEDHLLDINDWLLKLGAQCAVVKTRLVDDRSLHKAPKAAPTDEYAKYLTENLLEGQCQIHFVRAGNEDEGARHFYDPPRVSARLSPDQMGTGISQLVPIVVAARDRASLHWSIMQPELHLHPRVQAELGDLFIDSYHRFGNRFIIETHSEMLLLRCLRRIRETGKKREQADLMLRTDDIAIYFVQQVNGETTFKRIDVDINGDFIQPWPDDFFEIDFYERFPDAR